MPIRVYIVEDHPLMQQMLVDYLRLSRDLEVCGIASSAEEAALDIADASPTVVLLDLSLPGRSGLDLLAELHSKYGYPCLILSGHGERSYVGRALAAGARGYILKGRPHEIPIGIRHVILGGIYLSESLRDVIEFEREETGA